MGNAAAAVANPASLSKSRHVLVFMGRPLIRLRTGKSIIVAFFNVLLTLRVRFCVLLTLRVRFCRLTSRGA